MATNPKVSIVVPVYKTEQYLRECVDSILAQTFTDFEVILIESESPDDCGRICDEYAAKDGRVKTVHTEFISMVAARKRGIEIALGDYVGFVDSDDWIEPQMYETMYAKAVEVDADIVAVGHNYYYGGGGRIGSVEDCFFDGNDAVRSELVRVFMDPESGLPVKWVYGEATWDKLFRRRLLLGNIKYMDMYSNFGEDRVLNFINLLDADRVFIIGSSWFYHYRYHTSSAAQLDRSKDNSYEKYHTRCKTMFDTIKAAAGDKKFEHMDAVDMCIGRTGFGIISIYIRTKASIGEKRRFLAGYVKGFPAPRELALYAKNVSGRGNKVYGWLVMHKLYTTVILMKMLRDKLTGRD